MLANGSEYRGDYHLTRAGFAAFHRPRLEVLLEAGADLLAVETIPTIREADVVVALLGELGARGWLSYACRDGETTAAGEPIEDAVAFGDAPTVLAIGVNCTAPRYLPDLLASARGEGRE